MNSNEKYSHLSTVRLLSNIGLIQTKNITCNFIINVPKEFFHYWEFEMHVTSVTCEKIVKILVSIVNLTKIGASHKRGIYYTSTNFKIKIN